MHNSFSFFLKLMFSLMEIYFIVLLICFLLKSEVSGTVGILHGTLVNLVITQILFISY